MGNGFSTSWPGSASRSSSSPLVVAAARSPSGIEYAIYASWAGLALVLLYTLDSGARSSRSSSGRNARYGTLAASASVVGLGILVAVNYLSDRRRTSAGT